jgi:hypothetical protein
MKNTIRVFAAAAMICAATAEDGPSDSDLAKQTQNPIANLISLPLQNNFNFGVGPDDDVQYTLNVQPVYPTKISRHWNLINRVIAPVIYQPETVAGTGSEFGLGDTIYQGFFSPLDTGNITWGIGPVIQFPTATDARLGTEEWAAGPAAVVVMMPGAWVVGATAYNIWGIDADPDIDFMLFQYFVNYNFPSGWYLTSAPIITANWEAESGNKWTVPFGLGAGKVIHIGNQPMNTSLQAYANAERPSGGAEWQLRLQFQFLFPK